jgi:lantibiotic modifying enzyme
LSEKFVLGYAHGAAGVGDALLDLFEVTGDARFRTGALGAARWLRRLSVPALDDDSGVNWRRTADDADDYAIAWCHGATGIGQFFLHAAQHDLLPEARLLAERAARTVARGARWMTPTPCHGLAGNIEFLLDASHATGDPAYRSEARSLARLLEAFVDHTHGRLAWQSESPEIITPDFMVGYAGVAMCLLRLASPTHRPTLLSRQGFRC